ncbi:unnamed protein product [Closterium sp. NIES-54]
MGVPARNHPLPVDFPPTLVFPLCTRGSLSGCLHPTPSPTLSCFNEAASLPVQSSDLRSLTRGSPNSSTTSSPITTIGVTSDMDNALTLAPSGTNHAFPYTIAAIAAVAPLHHVLATTTARVASPAPAPPAPSLHSAAPPAPPPHSAAPPVPSLHSAAPPAPSLLPVQPQGGSNRGRADGLHHQTRQPLADICLPCL